MVLKVLQELRLGEPPAVAGRVDLRDALRNRWIEFWYQPKIDLRKKQLIGVEAYSRARHPQNGVLEPSAFMPGASEGDLVTLSELALDQALQGEPQFLQARRQPAARGQHPDQRAGQGAGGRHRRKPPRKIRKMAGPHHRRRRRADRLRPAARPTTSPRSSSTSTSVSRSTISAAAIPRLRGSRNCRSPSSSSTARSSPIAAATRSTRRCARPSSIWRTISAASRSPSASRRRLMHWRWSAWAATTARAFCSASRCPRSASFRCSSSAPTRRRVPTPKRRSRKRAGPESAAPMRVRRGSASRSAGVSPPRQLRSPFARQAMA